MSHCEFYWFLPRVDFMSCPQCGQVGRRFYSELPKRIKCSQALSKKFIIIDSAIEYIFVIESISSPIKYLS